ncbi:MAG: DUF1573 domain-containing protein [Bacteroidetes bacterium]|nr:MAG: DUF1573 domain-containing protein [Bacteroidota bacterium]
MKKLVFIFGAALLMTACNETDKKASQTGTSDTSAAKQPAATTNADPENYTTIEWIDNVNQALPKVKEGEIVEVTFRFKNTGNKPLVVDNVSASCGCTVPEKPEEPVMPGKEGLIKAKFDSHGRIGPNTKTLTVVANTNSEKMLNFSVEVVK